jgi:hypothetical protein
MTTILKKFHWYWAWEDENEEAWLRQMSQEGWHFQKVELPGFYTFQQGEPRDYAYRLDYLVNRKDLAAYLQLFQDAGWSYMGEMNNWQYFRKEAAGGVAPEIFTDNESKARKYQVIMAFLVVFMPITFITMINLNLNRHPLAQALMGILFVLFLFYVYIIVRLGLRLQQLRKKL